MEKTISNIKKQTKNGWNEFKDEAADAIDENQLDAHYPEIDEIRKDWKALKKDASELARHAGSDGSKKLSEFTNGSVEKLERQVKDRPAQTIAIAFAVGLVASLLFARR